MKHLCKTAILVAILAFVWPPIVQAQQSDALKAQYRPGEFYEEGEAPAYSVEKECRCCWHMRKIRWRTWR